MSGEADSPSLGSIRLSPFAMALSLATVVSAPLAAERLLVQNYTVADGLASDHVVSLATDRDGFLWVCTDSGLSRFDGSAFTTFRTGSGLPYPNINHFLQTRAGTRWVATNGGGVARLESDTAPEDGRVFASFPVGETPRSMNVNLLFETRDGALLAGTDGGLFRSPSAAGDPDFELVPLELPGAADSSLQIWSMIEDRAGDLWIGTSAGLARLPMHGRVEHMAVSPLQGADHVWTIVPDDEGRLWLGHDLGLVVWMPPPAAASGRASVEHRPLLDGGTPCVLSVSKETVTALPAASGQACHWAPQDPPTGANRLVRPVLQTADGTIWMTSRSGLVAFDGARFHVYAEPEATPSFVPGTIAEDPGGDLWVASVQGVTRILRRGFVQYTTEDGLAERQVNRIFQGPDGHLFAVTPTSHIHRFEGDHWTAIRPNVPAEVGRGGRSTYGAVLVDHRGEWWVGSGEGLFRFPRVAAIEELAAIPPRAHYTTADGLAGNDIRHLYEDRQGDLWIASRIPGREPLTRWRRQTGELQRFGPEHGLPAEESVRAFAEDRAGGLWVGLGTIGLARFDGTRFRLYATGRDLPQGFVGVSIHVGRRGGLWATVGGVLIHVPDPAAAEPRITPYPSLLTWSNYGVLAEDEAGWIYGHSSRGLARLQPESGAYYELGNGAPFTSVHRAYRDDRGTLWFITTKGGVLRYQPQPPRKSRPPPVWIDGVRVAGVSRPVPPMGVRRLGPLRLTPDQRQIQIDYFGLGFAPDAPLRFQVRLAGVDQEWGDPTTRRSAVYAGLGPGRYRFQARAITATGQVSRQPATVTFTIPPPFWRRAWFLTLVVAALVALLAAAYRLRVRRIVEIERVRTRIAADLHDDLGASLARVSLLSEAARRKLGEGPEAAEPMLREIGETSRGLVAAAGDIAYSIDPGRGSLDGLVARLRRFAEDLLVDTDIVWRLEVNGETSGIELSSDQRRHILAILKEALHNAVRHGRPRHLALTLAVRHNALSAELVDDGRGFSSGVPAGGEEPPAGHGLRSMRHRAREVGGRLRIDSDTGAGTRLTLEIPL